MKNAKQLIEAWVASRESFSFFLPEGSYGRPFDNQYHVLGIQKVSAGLEINLSGGIVFRVVGDVQLREEGCNLILSNFKELQFEVDGKLRQAFYEGEFCLSGF